MNKIVQKQHFDNEKNRYNVNKIFSPPIHTKLELDQLIGNIPKNIDCVVDFGSGNGRLTIPLLKLGYKVTAVDISVKSLKQLENIVSGLGLKIKKVDSLTKIIKSKIIVGSDILHHVDICKELNSMNNSLRKNGLIVFSEPNILNPSWIIYFFLKGIWKYERGIMQCSYFNFIKLLRQSNFRSIKIYGLGFFPRVFFKNKYICKLNDSLGNLPVFRIFAYRYIIVAKKF
jgi:2-polyprenyl-3-methyl-5-hydroxy-6-metoxy-1,4-benzoquinol methylase